LVLAALAGAAALPAADPVADTLDALRKAKTKEERLAALKGKDGEFLGVLLLRIFNEQEPLLDKGEFAEVERMQVWAEEVAALVPDAERRELCEVLCRLGRGRNETAQERFDEAAAVFKKLLADVRKNAQLKPLEPALLSNLGAVQYHQGDFVGG